MWQVTCDRWRVTRDTWHVTRDTWHMTQGVGWTFSQNFSFLALNGLGFMMLWISGGKGSAIHWINKEALCKTAPATPGLLIIVNTNVSLGQQTISTLTVLKFNHPVIEGLIHFVTESQSHCVTGSLSHWVTKSQNHRVPKSQSHRVTELKSYRVHSYRVKK